MTARDVLYGRRGGHWIPGDGREPVRPQPCRVCGHVVHVHDGDPGIHITCAADGPPPSLFDVAS